MFAFRLCVFHFDGDENSTHAWHTSIKVARSSSSHLWMKLASLWFCINIFELYDCARIGIPGTPNVIHPLSHTIITLSILCTSKHCERTHTFNRVLISQQLIDVIIVQAFILLIPSTTAGVAACWEVWKQRCCRKHAHQVPVYIDGISCVQLHYKRLF